MIGTWWIAEAPNGRYKIHGNEDVFAPEIFSRWRTVEEVENGVKVENVEMVVRDACFGYEQ